MEVNHALNLVVFAASPGRRWGSTVGGSAASDCWLSALSGTWSCWRWRQNDRPPSLWSVCVSVLQGACCRRSGRRTRVSNHGDQTIIIRSDTAVTTRLKTLKHVRCYSLFSRCVWAAVTERVVVCSWPRLRAAELWLAAAAAVAADGGAAADNVLLQTDRQTYSRPPLCLQRDAVHPQLHRTHMYPQHILILMQIISAYRLSLLLLLRLLRL